MGEHLTERQKFEFKEIFSLYDRDSDGIISKNDLEHLLNFLGLRLTKEELQDIVNEVNSEGDEKITYNSFLYLMARQIKDTGTSEEIIEAFTAFDDDHDGLIKTDDFRNYLKNMEEKLSEEEIDEIIKTADFGNNGMINYSELVKMKKN